MTKLAVILLALFSQDINGGAGGTPTEVRAHELRSAAPIWESGSEWEHLIPSIGSTEFGLDDDLERETALDSISDLLVELFSAEFEYEGRSVYFDYRHRLVARAPAPVHAGLERALGFLEDTFRAATPIVIDVIELDSADGAQPPAIVDLATADAWVAAAAAAGRHVEYRLNLQAGNPARVDHSRETAIVPDYDVEIANSSSTFDPIVMSVADGARLVLRGAPAGGGLRLTAVLRTTEAGEPHRVNRSLESRITLDDGVERVDGPRWMQVLACRNASAALSTWLAPGEVLVISSDWNLQSQSGGQRVLIRLAGPVPPALTSITLGGRRLGVVNLEAISPPHLEGYPFFSRDLPYGMQGRQTWMEPAEDGESAAFAANVGLASGHADEAQQGLFEMGLLSEEGAHMVLGPWQVELLEAGEGPDLDLAGLAALAPPVERLEARVALSEVRGGAPVTVARWTLPLLAGEDALTVLGVESPYAMDFDVEVAEDASVGDPALAHLFDGLLLRLRPERGASGRWGLDLSVRAHLLRGPLEPFDSSDPMVSAMDLPRHRNLMANERVLFPAEGPRRIVLGDTSRSREGALSLAIELR